MKTILITLFLLLSSGIVFASVSTEGLTQAQIAKLQLDAAQLAEQNKTPAVTPDTVKEWASIGTVIGDGLVDTASKIGMKANEFATTPVGFIAMFLIVWTYMGNDIVGIVFSFLWLSAMISLWVHLYRKKFVIERITIYDPKAEGSEGKKKVVDYYDKNTTSSDETQTIHILYWVTLLIIIAIGVIAAFA